MRWWMRRNFDGMARQSVIAVPFHPHFGFQTKKIEFSLFLLLDFGYLMLCGGERLFLYFTYWSTFWVLCNRLRWLLRLSISGLTRINTLVHYWLQKLAKLHFLAMSLQQDIARGVTAVTTTALSADWIAYIINLVDAIPVEWFLFQLKALTWSTLSDNLESLCQHGHMLLNHAASNCLSRN